MEENFILSTFNEINTSEEAISIFLKEIPKDEPLIEKILGFSITNESLYYHIFNDPDFNPKYLLIAFEEKKESESKNIIGILMGITRPWKKGNKEGWIKFLYVKKEFRRFGIGKRLLNKLNEYFKELGVEIITFGSSSPRYLVPGLPQHDFFPQEFFNNNGWNISSERTNLFVDISSLHILSVFSELKEKEQSYPHLQIHFSNENTRKKVISFIENNFSKSWAKEIQPALNLNNDEKFVCFLNDEEKDETLGFVAIGGTNPNWLGPMGVKESKRKKGFGKWILLAAINHLKNSKIKRLIIPWVNEDNYKFYNGVIGAQIHYKFLKMIFSF